ncbi:MAG: low affinity iron permease family protein [Acidobacteria bacterium]|nr:low affinity iron permease family protein [Acidobacteriota bacterium]
MKEWFRKFSGKMAQWSGSVYAFVLAVLLIVTWASAGPYYHWSDSHSLFINTTTTIITFLMVFLIQNTQNRDAKALHLKLDELIKATRGARNRMLDLDKLSDEQLKELEEDYKRICERDHGGDTGALKAIRDEREERSAAD